MKTPRAYKRNLWIGGIATLIVAILGYLCFTQSGADFNDTGNPFLGGALFLGTIQAACAGTVLCCVALGLTLRDLSAGMSIRERYFVWCAFVVGIGVAGLALGYFLSEGLGIPMGYFLSGWTGIPIGGY